MVPSGWSSLHGRCDAARLTLTPAAARSCPCRSIDLPQHRLQHTITSQGPPRVRLPQSCRASSKDNEEYTYSGALNQFLGRLLPGSGAKEDPLAHIEWGAPKRTGLSLAALRDALEEAWGRSPWMVTGEADPSLFVDDFRFKDPSVSTSSIRSYCSGVRKIFDQTCTKAELIAMEAEAPSSSTTRDSTSTSSSSSSASTPTSTATTSSNTSSSSSSNSSSSSSSSSSSGRIVVSWRLEGRVTLPGRPRIKPYVVTSFLEVDPSSGLVCAQEDIFDRPGWALVLPLGPPPAPPVEVLRAQHAERRRAGQTAAERR